MSFPCKENNNISVFWVLYHGLRTLNSPPFLPLFPNTPPSPQCFDFLLLFVVQKSCLSLSLIFSLQGFYLPVENNLKNLKPETFFKSYLHETLMSQDRAISKPPPNAAPSIAAMVGIGRLPTREKKIKRE